MPTTETKPALTEAREAELVAMFAAMSFDNLLDVYEIAEANGDTEVTTAMDRFMDRAA